jgi:hypothetical protein
MGEDSTFTFPFCFILTIVFHSQIALDEATESWGIKVERVEMYVLKPGENLKLLSSLASLLSFKARRHFVA